MGLLMHATPHLADPRLPSQAVHGIDDGLPVGILRLDYTREQLHSRAGLYGLQKDRQRGGGRNRR
jgi:hypothetical protein